MHRVRARLVGLAAIASVGCSIALDFSRVNLPATRDGGVMADVPVLADLSPDASDVADVADVADVPMALDVSDVPDVVDATDAPIAMDSSDVPDVLDAMDAPDAADALDAMDVVDVVDVVDAGDALDVVDVVDAGDASDVVDASDAWDASRDVAPDRADAGPPCDADLTSDPLNCGSCGRRCTLTYCNRGACSICRAPQTLCGIACYDLSTHAQHCGTCGTRCSGSTPTCCAGICRARCG